MQPRESIRFTLIYAEPSRTVSRQYSLEEGSTVEDALQLASADPAFSGIDAAQMPVGIYGRVVQRNHRLQEGDRVELYRPLAEDPKTARRQRARIARRNQ